MATATLPRPGVEVIQQIRSASPTLIRPTLVPFVTGAAKEVIELLNADGTLNPKAKQGIYSQLPKLIAQTAFPSPRGNILEVNVDEPSVRAFFVSGGQQFELLRDPGDSFLTAWNNAMRAAVQTKAVSSGFDLDNKIVVLAIDQIRLNTTEDVVITFSGNGLTAAQVAAQINNALGASALAPNATVIGTGVDARVQIASLIFGAESSVTIRKGGSANATLGLGSMAEDRVEGSGFRAQDQANNTTLSPWVEWTRGNYLADGVITTFPVIGSSTDPGYGLVDGSGVFATSQAPALTFTGVSSIDLRVGDGFYADGILPGGAQIMKVETTRFKLGTVDPVHSIFSATGRVVTPVYLPTNVSTLFAAAPFSPRFAWFRAENLTVTGNVATPAILTGSNEGTAATVASVAAPSTPAGMGPYSLAGLNLTFSVTVDGVVLDDQTFTFSGGPFADADAIRDAVNGGGLVGIGATSVGGKIQFSTTSTGALQALTLKASSTGLVALGFLAQAYSDTGKDVEFVNIPPNLLTSGNATFANLATAPQAQTTSNTFPMDIHSKTLVLKLSSDGGATYPDTRTHTFDSGLVAAADVAALISDIMADAPFIVGLHFSVASLTDLLITTTAVGSRFKIKVDATSSGIQAQTAGTLQYTNNQVFTGTSTTLVVKISADTGATYPTTRTHSFSSATGFSAVADVVTDISGDATFLGGGTPDLTVVAVGSELSIKAVAGDSTAALKADASSTGINGSGKLAYTSPQVAFGTDGISGHILKVRFNDRPRIYSTVFVSNSLVDAVAAINLSVGWPVASIGGLDSDQLVITSDLKGYASKVEVIDDSASGNDDLDFGFAEGNRIAIGSGRPLPDFYLDISGNVVLGSDIIRNLVTGAPLDPGQSDVYLAYTGLRLDVSPIAKKPGLINLSDIATLQTVLDPINSKNPLGLGMFFAMLNAPGVLCTGMGVDETTAAAPEGTLLGYAKVAGFLESQEVYAIAPLTHDETVAQMWKAHIELMAQADQKGERILFFNPLTPVRAVDEIISSGESGNSDATTNEFILDVNPSAALLAAGINPALPIPVDADLYLEITVAGVVRIYSVADVNGVVVTLRNSFTAPDNVDGFFTTSPLTESVVNGTWTMAVRGAPLVITGSTLPDKQAIASTVADKSGAYKQRRMYYVFPDNVEATLDGQTEALPAYYACAAICGMIAHFPPQQGFTNLPMAGFIGVQGSNDTFSPRQLDLIAGGGTYILVQDAAGGPLTSRMQLSTDLTSIETRELSITKMIDFTAKFLRAGLRRFIGTFNITTPFLDSLSTVIHGMLKFLEEQGVLISGDLNNLIQDKSQPDTVLVDVTLNLPFPCNYIRLTLAV